MQILRKGDNEMTQLYNTISIVTFSLAGVGFLVSIFLWFKFEIWDIIGDLSGRNAKKSIEQMRQENDKTGVKMYHPNSFGGKSGNTEISVRMSSTKAATSGLKDEKGRGFTGKMKKTGALVKEETELLKENTVSMNSEETALLESETELLQSETELLEPETELLEPETELLGEATGELPRTGNPVKLVIIQSIVLIHTEEQM